MSTISIIAILICKQNISELQSVFGNNIIFLFFNKKKRQNGLLIYS